MHAIGPMPLVRTARMSSSEIFSPVSSSSAHSIKAMPPPMTCSAIPISCAATAATVALATVEFMSIGKLAESTPLGRAARADDLTTSSFRQPRLR